MATADLNSLLLSIQNADKQLAEANQFLAEAQGLVANCTEALRAAQEAFDRAVCEARGVPYVPLPAVGAPVAPSGPEAPATEFAPTLPPPVPVGPQPARAITGGQLGPAYEADDRPEGVGE